MNRFILWCVALGISIPLSANNVRVTRDVSADINGMTAQFVELNLGIEWENSWRDDFNWDATYIFLKCRKKGTAEWSHMYLRPDFHRVSDGYSWWLANTGNGSYAQGIFIHRSRNGSGMSSVDITLQWAYPANGLAKTDFIDQKVEFTAMCIETVYVPNGAFYIGDNYSNKTLASGYRPIHEKWDLIKDDGKTIFGGDGDPTTVHYQTYPPSNAANRVNMNGTNLENAWYATQSDARWLVTFREPKTVRYFGVSGVAGRPVPSKWSLQGKVDGRWEELFGGEDGIAANWPSGDYDSYPVSKALKVKNPRSCTEYMISVEACAGAPALNNVSMTEEDLSKVTDFAYVVDYTPSIPLNTSRGMYADDGDGYWNTTLSASYPTGFYGFYVMKYEISQEQYVKFLNKLTFKQQQNRTIGAQLASLKMGDFVYGTDRTKPNCRNGIVVASLSENGGPMVFANNLNSSDDAISQEDDGMSLACNYVSFNDMLAYADWSGLRPMSEMEFEKAARKPFPDIPEQGEYAWNSGDLSTLKTPTGLTGDGTAAEKATGANVNAANRINGPVRCGSFAKDARSLTEAGSGYWGAMELSGNLAEISYNVNYYGRGFQQITQAHGDGFLDANGEGNLSASYWPKDLNGIGVKGGSFKSEQEKIAISDRSFVKNYFSNLNKKDSTVTFRLAHSYVSLLPSTGITYLRLENNMIGMSDGAALDTLCSGSTYTIKGSDLLESSTVSPGGRVDVKKKYQGRCEYIWYVSENSGSTWNIIPGARESNLTSDRFKNDASTMRPVWVRRLMITPEYTSMSKYVVLNVVNDTYQLYRSKDTVQAANHVLGCLVTTKSPAQYTWRWKGQGTDTDPVRNVVTNGVSDFYCASRKDFNNIAGTAHTVTCEIRVQKKCIRKIDVEIYVKERPKVAVLSSDINKKNEGDATKRCGVMMMDARDGKVYGTVKIGDQCWMSENVRFSVAASTNNQPIDPSGENLGSFYAHSAAVVNNACPAGWRMPADADFNELITYLNKDGFSKVGIKMKSGNYWNVDKSNNLTAGTNSSGFGAVAGGYFSNTYLGTGAYFLTSESHYYGATLTGTDFSYIGGAGGTKMNIRCIKK